MSARRAIEIGLLIGVAAGLLTHAVREAKWSPYASARGEVTTLLQNDATSPDARDYQVIEVVLRDLLDYKGKGTPLAMEGPGRDRIFFARTSAHPGAGLDDIREAFSLRRGIRLSASEQAILQELITDIRGRSREVVEFPNFAPRDRRIVVRGSTISSRPYSELDPPIEAALPGYTRNGKAAVACLLIPWSIHCAGGFYLLARQGDTWRVVQRSFLYYP